MQLFVSMEGKNKTSLVIRWIKSPWPLVMALLFLSVYMFLDDIIRLILPYTRYHRLPGFTADIAANYLRPDLARPLSDWVSLKGAESLYLIPYYLVLGYLIFLVHLLLKPYYKHIFISVCVVLLFLRVFPGTLLLFDSNEPSIAEGKPDKGKLQNGRRIPYHEDGYHLYSFLGYVSGRTYVHEEVNKVLIESFDMLEEKVDNRRFYIGEASTRAGGPNIFHKGKQNGMEVDVLLPLNKGDKAYESSSILSMWNYGLEIDDDGKIDEMTVDFKDLATMMSVFNQVADKHDLRIRKIEMHPKVMRGLYGARLGSLIKNILGMVTKRDAKSSPAYMTLVFEPKKEGGFLRRLIE